MLNMSARLCDCVNKHGTRNTQRTQSLSVSLIFLAFICCCLLSWMILFFCVRLCCASLWLPTCASVCCMCRMDSNLFLPIRSSFRRPCIIWAWERQEQIKNHSYTKFMHIPQQATLFRMWQPYTQRHTDTHSHISSTIQHASAHTYFASKVEKTTT